MHRNVAHERFGGVVAAFAKCDAILALYKRAPHLEKKVGPPHRTSVLEGEMICLQLASRVANKQTLGEYMHDTINHPLPIELVLHAVELDGV
jgi:hypothetical protein